MATVKMYSRQDIFVYVRAIIGASRRIRLSFPLHSLNESHRLKEHLGIESANDLIEFLLGLKKAFEIDYLPPEDVRRLEITLGSGSIANMDWQPSETATIRDLVDFLQTILEE